MPNTYGTQDVKCPFFKNCDTMKISCEGIVDQSSVKLCFGTKNQKENYRRLFCECDYETCRLYKMLYGKYE